MTPCSPSRASWVSRRWENSKLTRRVSRRKWRVDGLPRETWTKTIGKGSNSKAVARGVGTPKAMMVHWVSMAFEPRWTATMKRKVCWNPENRCGTCCHEKVASCQWTQMYPAWRKVRPRGPQLGRTRSTGRGCPLRSRRHRTMSQLLLRSSCRRSP